MKFKGIPNSVITQDGKKVGQFDAEGFMEISEAQIVEKFVTRMKRAGFVLADETPIESSEPEKTEPDNHEKAKPDKPKKTEPKKPGKVK